jgi:hypothetical protein
MDGVNPPKPPRSRAALFGALIYAALLLVIPANAFLFWSGDLLTVIGFPLALLGLIVLAHTGLAAFRHRDVLPIAIAVSTILIATLVPFSKLARDFDFWRYHAAREAAASEALRRYPRGNVEAPISGGGAVLSHGGRAALMDNVVAITDCGHARCVLFFLWRRSEFQPNEGFLFVQPGGDPGAFQYYGAFNARRLAEHWYYAVEQ